MDNNSYYSGERTNRRKQEQIDSDKINFRITLIQRHPLVELVEARSTEAWTSLAHGFMTKSLVLKVINMDDKNRSDAKKRKTE